MQTITSPSTQNITYFSNSYLDSNGLPSEVKAEVDEFKRITKGNWVNTDALSDPALVRWFQGLSLAVIDAIITNPDGSAGYGLNFGFQQLLSTRQIDYATLGYNGGLSKPSIRAIFKTIASGGTQADISKFSRATIVNMLEAMTEIQGDWVGVGPDGIWVWQLTAAQVADLSANQPDLGALLFKLWVGPTYYTDYASHPIFIQQFKALSSASIDILINGYGGAPALGLNDKYLDLLTVNQFMGLNEKTRDVLRSSVLRLNKSLSDAQKLSLSSSPLLLYAYATTGSQISQTALTVWVRSLTQPQVKTLSVDQVLALGAYISQLSSAAIAALSPEQFSALTITQLLTFTPEHYAGISAAQLAAVPVEKIKAIHIDWLTNSAITGGLTAQNINGITDAHYFSTWITDPATITAISPKAFAALKIEQLLAISKSNYQGISAEQLATIPEEKIKAIHIDWLTNSAIAGGLTAQNINGITDARYFSTWITDPATITAIHPDAFAALTPTQLSWFSASNPTALAGLSGAQLGSLSAPQAQAFSPASISLISPQSIAAAGSGFINRLSDAQFNQLTHDQLNAVMVGLSPTLLSAERFSQLASPARVSLISTAAWAKVSQAQMSALSPDAFAALVPAQLGALTNAAVLGITKTQMSLRYPLGSKRAEQDLEALRVIANQPYTPGRSLMAVNDIYQSGIYTAIYNNNSYAIFGEYGDYAGRGSYGYGYDSGGGGSEGQPSITTQQLLDANTDQIKIWQANTPGALSQAVSGLTPEQAGRLSGPQLVALKDCLGALPIAAIPGITSAAVSSIDPDYFTNAQLNAMDPSQVHELDLTSMPTERLVVLGVSFIDKVDAWQLSSGQIFQLILGLTPLQFSTSNFQFLSGLSPVEMAYTFSRAGGNYLAALSADQMNQIFGGFTPAYMDTLDSTDSATIESFVGMVLPASYGLLSPQTVANISPTVLGWLLPTQVAAADITLLPGNVIASAGIGFVNGMSPTQVTHLYVSQQLVGLLSHLTPTEFAQINPAFFSALPVGTLASALNTIRRNAPSQFDALVGAFTTDQADAVFTQIIALDSVYAGQPSPSPAQRASHEELVAFAKVLPTSFYNNLSFGTLSWFKTTTFFDQLSEQQRQSADVINRLINSGTEGLLTLSAQQIGGLTIPQINALLTHSVGFANVMLNVGTPNAWSREQFEAMLAIPGVIASINPTVLGNSLSIDALLNLNVAQIGQLTGAQWQAILNNPTLSKVAFNAGRGQGYWSLEQLKAVSRAAIPYMTQDQYLQFEDGLVMFSQAQQGAMTTNVAIVVIMFTGRTDGWTQDQIAQVVNTVPGMIPLSGLPGGGGCFGMPRVVPNQHQVTNYATTNDSAVLAMALYPDFLATLTPAQRGELVNNTNLRPLLAQVSAEQLVIIMSSPDLMGALFGANFFALVKPITQFMRYIQGTTLNTLVPLNNLQITALVSSEDGHIALAKILFYAPRLIPDHIISAAHVWELIKTETGQNVFTGITEVRPFILANGAITAEGVIALISRNSHRMDWVIKTLSALVKNVPAAFAAGVLTTSVIEALLTIDGAANLLTEFAESAPLAFANGALDAAIMHILMMLKNNLPEWVVNFSTQIAQSAPAAFAIGSLNTAFIEILIRRLGIAALSEIAATNPAAFANRAFTETILRLLLQSSTGLELLLTILPSYLVLMDSPADALTLISNRVPAYLLTLSVIERLSATPAGLSILNQLPAETVQEITADLKNLDTSALIKIMDKCRLLMNNLTTFQAKSLFSSSDTRNSLRYYLHLIGDEMSASFLAALVRGSYYQNSPDDITGMTQVPLAALAGLNPVEANRLEPFFWRYITTAQLTAMMNSETLGAGYFGNIGNGGPAHISMSNMNLISPKTLVAAYKNTNEAVQQAIRLEKNDLTDQQLQAFKNADIPGFNLLSNIQYGLAGNQLLIDQQPSSDQGKVATAATWDKASTVTVSAAEFSAAQKQSLLGVLDQYAALTGLSFQMVDTGGQIDLGFDNLGTLSTGVVGSTTLHEDQGQIQSAQIVLENPAEDPLDANGIYGGTQASFTQVLMHELGHALGLADNNIAGSIENFYLDSSNQTLSDYDVQALQTLYGTAASAPVAKDRHAATVTTSALLDQLKQAMASASPFNDGMSSTSTGSFFSAQGVQGSPTVSLPSR